MKTTLSDLARLVGGTIVGGGDAEIAGVAKIEDAEPGDITFLSDLRYRKHLLTTRATAVLVAEGSLFQELDRRSAPLRVVAVRDPYEAFLVMVDRFHPSPPPLPAGIHPTAVVAGSARVSALAAVGAHVVIGERCTVADRASLHPGTVLGDDVAIGADSLLYMNVSVREGCTIGKNVIIHPGTVIGSDGFGFLPRKDGSYKKIPQRGIVVIEDDVEIGANCTIDRATIGETRIGRGVKLDNLVHVAHNVVIGEDTAIAAQTGISGSSKIGRQCAFGGQVGLVGHIEIAEKTTIGAQSGVPKSITEPGKTWFGYPARELHETLRIEGAVRQLPALLNELRELQKRIHDLEQRQTVHPTDSK